MRSAHTFRATTAAALATKRSSMPSKQWRRAAPEVTDEDHRRRAAWPLRARPAQLLYRALGAAAQSRSAHPGPRPICERRDLAAHGACGVRALALRPWAHHGD